MKVEYTKEEFDKWWNESANESEHTDEQGRKTPTRLHPSSVDAAGSVLITSVENGEQKRLFISKKEEGVT
jgi:hypothetical protein